jgi:acetyl esterase/lipase
VLFYPCVDASTDEEASYGGPAIGAHGKEVSPILHLRKGLPPMVLFQGTADSLYEKNRSYCAQVAAQGDRCEFVEYAGAGHGFFNEAPRNAQWYDMALARMDTYLERAGYLAAQ